MVVELGHHVVVVEEVAVTAAFAARPVAGDLVAAAIDRVEQRLGEVDAGAEELHLLAERIADTQQAMP
jgi:hypothetical protein